MGKKNLSYKNVLNIIGKIISWVIFIILILAAVFLLYYYVATRIYAKKGHGYEPAFSIYTIISPSMEPKIMVSDAVVDIKVNTPNDVQVGDVITFISTSPMTNGLTITHRVQAITKDENNEICYQTKGDNNNVSDDSCAKFKNILGKVIFKIPRLGKLQQLLASRAGWLFLILIPALVIISKDILRLTKLNNIKVKTDQISGPPKVDQKKLLEEQKRKEELKQRLLKEDKKIKEYYKEPEVKVIEKSKKEKANLPKTKNKKTKKKI